MCGIIDEMNREIRNKICISPNNQDILQGASDIMPVVVDVLF